MNDIHFKDVQYNKAGKMIVMLSIEPSTVDSIGKNPIPLKIGVLFFTQLAHSI